MTGQARRVDEQLAAFCEAEHAQLTGLLTLVTRDRHVAEEFAQETLERACAEWRANRRHGEPTASIEETAVSLAVRAAVASLPPRQRTVIELRFFVGLDVAQTATVMSIDARPAELGSPQRALTGPGTSAATLLTRPLTRGLTRPA